MKDVQQLNYGVNPYSMLGAKNVSRLVTFVKQVSLVARRAGQARGQSSCGRPATEAETTTTATVMATPTPSGR